MLNRRSLLRNSFSVHSSKMYSQSFNMHLSSTGNFLSVYMIATLSYHSLCSYTPKCFKQIFVMQILIVVYSIYIPNSCQDMNFLLMKRADFYASLSRFRQQIRKYLCLSIIYSTLQGNHLFRKLLNPL